MGPNAITKRKPSRTGQAYLACLAFLAIILSTVLSAIPMASVRAADAPPADWELLLPHPGGPVSADSGGVYVAEPDTDQGNVIQKYNSNGTEAWTRPVGEFYYVDALFASSGSLYVTGGHFYDPAYTSGDYAGGYLRRYDTAGNLVWESPVWDGTNGFPAAVAADSSGIYVAGYVSDWMTEQSGSFVARYDNSGHELWCRVDDSYDATSVAACSGSVYVGGRKGDEGFIRRYDTAGNEDWYRLSGFVDDIAVGSVSADASGVYVAGTAGDDGFVRKYNSAGDQLWTVKLNGDFNGAAGVSACSGAVYVAGTRDEVLEGDFFVRYIWVHKYDTAGRELWAGDYFSAEATGVNGFAACSGGLYLTCCCEGEGFLQKVPVVETHQPLTVTTVKAASVASSSATLKGNVGSLGSATSAQVSFEWGATKSYGRTTASHTVTGTGSFSAALSGLTPGATYHYRAIAAAGDTVARGADRSFTTPAIENRMADRPVNALPQAGALGVDLMPVLQGSAFHDADGDAHAASRWQIRSAAGDYDSSPVWDSGSAAAASSVTVPSGKLRYSAEYYWRVGYRDSRGLWSQYSQETSFTTAGIPDPGMAVSTLEASGVDSGSATLSLRLTGPATAEAVQVHFEWGLTEAYGSATAPRAVTGAGSYSSTISGLAAGTTYHFRAVALGAGETLQGADRYFQTPGPVDPDRNFQTPVPVDPGDPAAPVGPDDPLIPVDPTAVPAISALVANAGQPGDQLTVTITGSHLSGATAVSFGAGIVVDGFRVISDSEITARIALGNGAEAGLRDVTVVAAAGTSTLTGGFTVDAIGAGVHLWVYVVAAAGGVVGLGLVTSVVLWLRRHPAR